MSEPLTAEELAAMRQRCDTARLDWLEAHKHEPLSTVYFVLMEQGMRAAIDAARRYRVPLMRGKGR